MSLYPDHHRCAECDSNKRHGGHGFCSDDCERRFNLREQIRQLSYDGESLRELASQLDFEAAQHRNLARRARALVGGQMILRAKAAEATAAAIRALMMARMGLAVAVAA